MLEIFVIAVIVMVNGFLMYQVFLSDIIQNNKLEKQKNQLAISNTEKMARVKLVSDNAKDIEQFIANNAQYLSDVMVAKLVERIEMIRCEKVILEDSLKNKIEALAPDKRK